MYKGEGENDMSTGLISNALRQEMSLTANRKQSSGLWYIKYESSVYKWNHLHADESTGAAPYEAVRFLDPSQGSDCNKIDASVKAVFQDTDLSNRLKQAYSTDDKLKSQIKEALTAIRKIFVPVAKPASASKGKKRARAGLTEEKVVPATKAAPLAERSFNVKDHPMLQAVNAAQKMSPEAYAHTQQTAAMLQALLPPGISSGPMATPEETHKFHAQSLIISAQLATAVREPQRTTTPSPTTTATPTNQQ